MKELAEGDRSIPFVYLDTDKASPLLNRREQFLKVEVTIMGIAYFGLDLKEELLRLLSSLFRC
jgi:hypothetical protein